MIFEILEKSNTDNTIVVLIDNNTFNQIMKMLICEAYHEGMYEHANMDADDSKEN